MLQLLGYYILVDNNLLDSQLPTNLWLTNSSIANDITNIPDLKYIWTTKCQNVSIISSCIRMWDTWSLCIWYTDCFSPVNFTCIWIWRVFLAHSRADGQLSAVAPVKCSYGQKEFGSFDNCIFKRMWNSSFLTSITYTLIPSMSNLVTAIAMASKQLFTMRSLMFEVVRLLRSYFAKKQATAESWKIAEAWTVGYSRKKDVRSFVSLWVVPIENTPKQT